MKLVFPPSTGSMQIDNWLYFVYSALNHVPNMYLHTFTWDPPSIASGAVTSTTQTIDNADMGDWCFISAEVDLQNIIATGYVSSSNTVTIQLFNPTASAIDLSSATWNLLILKKM